LLSFSSFSFFFLLVFFFFVVEIAGRVVDIRTKVQEEDKKKRKE